jgi:hypothetical protein
MMLKSISSIGLLVFSLSAIAAPVMSDLTTTPPDQYQFARWCMNHQVGNDTCPTRMSYQATRPSTIIIYVAGHFGDNHVSDPVHVVCNNGPVIIQAGSSLICRLPANGSIVWYGEPDYIKNGAEGGFVWVE